MICGLRAHTIAGILPDGREHVLLAVEGGGHRSVGEAAPLPGYSPETIACARDAALRACRALEEVMTRDLDVSDGRALRRAADDLEHIGRLADAPSVRFAAETALLDWHARRSGHSVAELLAVRPQPRVPVSGLVPRGTQRQLVEAVERHRARGLSTVKIKVSPTLVTESFAALEVARDAFPGHLRLDANGSWGPNPLECLARLGSLGVQWVEEPAHGEDLLRISPGTCPWAVDESLVDGDLAMRLARERLCRAFVLKPTLLGGFYRCLDLAEEAQAQGIDVTVTHTFEGPVALAAACELALALPGRPMACGLDPHGNLAGTPPLGVATLVDDGWVTNVPRLGLGLQ